MIKKQRKVPIKILALEALLRRLPPSHIKRKDIQEALARSRAGYRGEQAIDYHLSFIDEKRYHILHDLRIPTDKGYYFQIDTLILSPSFYLILEVKNISGTLYFDESFHQLIRIEDGREESFPDPLLQVRRQHISIKNWLDKKRIMSPPIVSVVVISHSSTTIKRDHDNPHLSEKVIHSDTIPFKIEKLRQVYNKDVVTLKELNKTSRLLIKNHTLIRSDILQQYQIHKEELLTGVYCPQCNKFPIMRCRGYWFCTKCYYKSSDAVLPSLKDYSLLLQTRITNQQFREFINVTSSSVASKLIRSFGFTYSGRFKDRKYELPYDQWFK